MPKSAVFAIAVLLCLASGLYGGAVSYTQVYFEARSNFIPSLCDCQSYTGTTSVAASYGSTGLGGDGAFSGSGIATSAFGTLTALGTAVITDFPRGSNVGLYYYDSNNVMQPIWRNFPVAAVASFTDQLTLLGPEGSYSLLLDVFVTGEVEITAPGIGADIRIIAGSSDLHRSATLQYTTPGKYELLLPNIPANTPFNLTYSLVMQSFIVDRVAITDSPLADVRNDPSIAHITDVLDTRPGPYSGSVTLDFAHTATFGQYEATLPSGAAATGVSLVSANGFAYTPVPEPAAFILIPVPLFAALAVVRRRSRAVGN